MCNNPCNPCHNSSCNCRYNGPDIPELGIIAGMPYDEVIEIISTYVSGIDFEDGVGIDSTSYNATTGQLTLNFTNSTSYTTGDLRGPQGPTGPQGPVGPQGPLNPYSMEYIFSATTVGAPSATEVRFNDADVRLVTNLSISHIDSQSVNQFGRILGFVNAENNVNPVYADNRYGILRLSLSSDYNNYVDFEVLGIGVSFAYTDITVKYLSTTALPTTFSDTDAIVLTFTPYQTVTSEIKYIITNWDMVTNNLYSIPVATLIPHGFSPDKVADISVYITSDNMFAPNHIPLDRYDTQSNGSVLLVDSTNIVLSRTTGGVFDDANYSGTGFRGYALIKYFK